MLSNIWVWDPGSGKNLFRIPDPGSRGQKGTGSRIQDPDPQHCIPDPGVKKAPDPGSKIRIRNTAFRIQGSKRHRIPDPQRCLPKSKCTALPVTLLDPPEEPHVNLHLRVQMLRMLQQTSVNRNYHIKMTRKP
jgi:hypothetical protein